MTSTAADISTDAFKRILDRLSHASIDTYYNPYKAFEWPDTMPDAQMWMSRDLLSVHDTDAIEGIPEANLQLLSKWESMNFYSLNVHGIRDLLIEVTRRIHTPGFEDASEFFHHFLGEENEHMWFFAEFCLRYGKVYHDRSVRGSEPAYRVEVNTLLVFSRILIFEEIVDYFNRRMGKDESLHPCIRQINEVHHRDETRHIAFGRELVKLLFARASKAATAEELQQIEQYVKRFVALCMTALYNPSAYRDAGIAEPYELRRRLLASPARAARHRQFCANLEKFFVKAEIIGEGGLFDESDIDRAAGSH